MKSNVRLDLYEIDLRFSEMLDDFYKKYKEKLKGKPHSLGMMKERMKQRLFIEFEMLALYIDDLAKNR